MKDDKVKILCSKCKEEIDIMSVRQIESNAVEITFICPSCGQGKRVREFLYNK